jgi:hypothetical protein
MAYVHPLDGDDLVKDWQLFNKAHEPKMAPPAHFRLRALITDIGEV